MADSTAHQNQSHFVSILFYSIKYLLKAADGKKNEFFNLSNNGMNPWIIGCRRSHNHSCLAGERERQGSKKLAERQKGSELKLTERQC